MINYERLETYLKDLGSEIRQNLIPFIATPTVTFQDRYMALQMFDNILRHVKGMLFTVSLIDSPEKAEYYKQYFDQACSKQGLDGKIR